MATLLIVDDERVLVRELSRSLAAEGHEVRTAGTGAQAIEANRLCPPDLVLLDLRLPDRSGIEVLRELRGLDPGLPVVQMTAHGSVRDAVKARHEGATD